MADNCGNCRFFKAVAEDYGLCQLNPPEQNKVSQTFVTVRPIDYSQPMTREGNWCSHHQPDAPVMPEEINRA